MKPGRELDQLIADKITTWKGSYILPHYSIDITAAWDVIRKIKSRQSIVVIHFTDSNDEGENATCEIYDKQRNMERGLSKDHDWYAGGETLAHAICLCALKEEAGEI